METSIILVRPQFSGNLGSVARAMKNMGLSELRLVDPEASPKASQAKQMAVHAKDVLEKARVYSDLKEALRGIDLVVGTSRRSGGDRSNWTSPREFAEFSQDLPDDSKVAIIFGTEDTGLTNEEIALCQKIIHIPSHESCPSLNLAQAVMVVGYELFLAGLNRRGDPPGRPPEENQTQNSVLPAQVEKIEAMYEDLGKLLLESGFLDKKNPDHLMQLIRNLFNRARPTEKEVKIIRGICRQLRWWAGNSSIGKMPVK